MTLRRISLADAIEDLPPEWPHDPLPAIRAAMHGSRQKIVVLDDDPTGTQTVHDFPVLTEWSVETLAREMANDLAAFYVLTNSRGLTLAEAQSLNLRIGRNLVEAAQRTDRTPTVVSRSDSTLRGHFPGELEALAEALGQDFDAWVLVPFFLEGGRVHHRRCSLRRGGRMAHPRGRDGVCARPFLWVPGIRPEAVGRGKDGRQDSCGRGGVVLDRGHPARRTGCGFNASRWTPGWQRMHRQCRRHAGPRGVRGRSDCRRDRRTAVSSTARQPPLSEHARDSPLARFSPRRNWTCRNQAARSS